MPCIRKWGEKNWGWAIDTDRSLTNLRFANDLFLTGRSVHHVEQMLQEAVGIAMLSNTYAILQSNGEAEYKFEKYLRIAAYMHVVPACPTWEKPTSQVNFRVASPEGPGRTALEL